MIFKDKPNSLEDRGRALLAQTERKSIDRLRGERRFIKADIIARAKGVISNIYLKSKDKKLKVGARESTQEQQLFIKINGLNSLW